MLILSMTACEAQKPQVSSEDKTDTQTEAPVEVEQKEPVEDEEKVVEEEKDPQKELSSSEFILKVFQDKGYHLSIEDLIIKQEGPKKIAAIYKPNNRFKAKLIILEDGESYRILHWEEK